MITGRCHRLAMFQAHSPFPTLVSERMGWERGQSFARVRGGTICTICSDMISCEYDESMCMILYDNVWSTNIIIWLIYIYTYVHILYKHNIYIHIHIITYYVDVLYFCSYIRKAQHKESNKHAPFTSIEQNGLFLMEPWAHPTSDEPLTPLRFKRTNSTVRGLGSIGTRTPQSPWWISRGYWLIPSGYLT